MKTKKVLLGGLVVVFALGSVIASSFAPTTAFVKAETAQDPEDCVALNVQCESTGDVPCTVQVPVLSGPNITDKVYSDDACSIRLFHNSAEVLEATSPTVIELLEPGTGQ